MDFLLSGAQWLMSLHKLLYIRATHKVVRIASCSSMLGQGANWGLTANLGFPSQVLHLVTRLHPQGRGFILICTKVSYGPAAGLL